MFVFICISICAYYECCWLIDGTCLCAYRWLCVCVCGVVRVVVVFDAMYA